ncbi:hypothetical protein niasHS_010667 [Heterodera schachtii]|uniref:G-protein coupled receptors family 1 profile domain-containing protein n=1 Tax=Heterodera schachtii TaxID=97005 RepID=A0ABD2IYD9_HETSC
MHCANDPPLFDFDSNSTRAFIQSLVGFQKAYAPIHGRICVFLCLFGVVTNLIHCVVLTRPQMRVSAVNFIMTAVALCDLGTMGSYLVYIIHFVFQNTSNSCSNPQSYLWMLFLILHIFFSILLHTATLWLAVVMAFLRRMTLHRNILYSHWQRAPLARCISTGVLGSVFLLSVPSLLVHEIIEFPHNRWIPPAQCSANYPVNYSESVFTVIIRQSALANGCVLFKTNLWLTGFFFKVIPCLLLLTLSCSLMQKLRQAEKKQGELLENGGLGTAKADRQRNSGDASGAAGGNGRGSPAIGGGTPNLKKINSDRTTAILLAILTVFLFTELPQGLIAILNAIYTADVHRFIYLTLGDLLDLLSLVNSSCNFVLYCLMSSQYRQTFCSLLSPIVGFKRCVTSAHHQPIQMVPNFASEGIGNKGGTAVQMSEMRRRRSTPIYRWMIRDSHPPPAIPRPKLSACSQLLRPPSAIREF